MSDKHLIRGPDGDIDKELLEEIRIMFVFQELIRQDMREFVEKGKSPPFKQRE
ncbi:MAG: hypothetical protein IKQ97_02685 [Eubacterium sp.]|nr:hypothetical protein [Eubacterium sp.]